LINVVSAGRCVVAGHSYGATHIIAEGSGHAVPLDRPVLVAETILGLTRALPPQ